jgi:hypothetical protein
VAVSAKSAFGTYGRTLDAQQAEVCGRRAEGAILAERARSYHVGKSTISRLTALVDA